MIRLIEALEYRCLRYVRQEIGDFHVLVGPNASGKSAFLDVIGLLGDILRNGLSKAIADRSPSLLSLVWMESGSRIELAVELDIPEAQKAKLPPNGFKRARYEVAIGLNSDRELSILGETLWLKPEDQEHRGKQGDLFPNPTEPDGSVVLPEGRHAPSGWKKVVTKKSESGNDYYFSETTRWQNPFRLGPQRLALGNLPEDEERFPVSTWVKRHPDGRHSALGSEQLGNEEAGASGKPRRVLARRFEPPVGCRDPKGNKPRKVSALG